MYYSIDPGVKLGHFESLSDSIFFHLHDLEKISTFVDRVCSQLCFFLCLPDVGDFFLTWPELGVAAIAAGVEKHMSREIICCGIAYSMGLA